MFPTGITTVTSMNASDTLKVAGHSTRHNNELKPIVEALEAKVGVDASAVTTTHDYKLSGVTSTDKAVSKTGSETLTNKNLTTPTITNKSSTGTDSGTETLVNKTLTSPVLNTPTFSTGAIPNTALATSAITLGYANITSDFNTVTVGSDVDITGLSKTVTVPAGGRYVKITIWASDFYTSAASGTDLYLRIKESTSVLTTGHQKTAQANDVAAMTVIYVVAASAGSHTYKAAFQQSGAGTMHCGGNGDGAFLLVELI